MDLKPSNILCITIPNSEYTFVSHAQIFPAVRDALISIFEDICRIYMLDAHFAELFLPKPRSTDRPN